jgi:hypothetical protein
VPPSPFQNLKIANDACDWESFDSCILRDERGMVRFWGRGLWLVCFRDVVTVGEAQLAEVVVCMRLEIAGRAVISLA